MELQTEIPPVQNSRFLYTALKTLLWTFPSSINLFSDHSFYEKVKFVHKWSCKGVLPLFWHNSNFIPRPKVDIPIYYQFIPKPLLIWESQIFHKWSCRQEPALFGVEFKLFARDSNFLLQTFRSFFILFQDRSFFDKVNLFSPVELQTGTPICLVRNSNKTIKFSFLFSSPCFQSTHSMRKSNLCISGVADRDTLCMKRTMTWCCRHGTPLL